MNTTRYNFIPTYKNLDEGLGQRKLNSCDFLFIVDGEIFDKDLNVVEVEFDYQTNENSIVFIEISDVEQESTFLFDEILDVVYYYEL